MAMRAADAAPSGFRLMVSQSRRPQPTELAGASSRGKARAVTMGVGLLASGDHRDLTESLEHSPDLMASFEHGRDLTASLVTDARIQPRVGEVHDQVEGDQD